MLKRLAAAALLFVLGHGAASAQRGSTAISEAEEEQIRDSAPEPARRVVVYQTIIDARIRRIQAILADKRAQGRREDLQQNMEEIAGLVDEFQDNLEEYDSAHRDLRKPIPKLIEATQRWESVIRQLPDDPSYDLTRKLALEAVTDVKQELTDLLPAQTAYFKEHPPDKTANPGGIGEVHHE